MRIVIVFLIAVATLVPAATANQLTSSNGRLAARVWVDEQGQVRYELNRVTRPQDAAQRDADAPSDDLPLARGVLGLKLADANLIPARQTALVKVPENTVYLMPLHGAARRYAADGLRLGLESLEGRVAWAVEARLLNDGLALAYRTFAERSYAIVEESTTIELPSAVDAYYADYASPENPVRYWKKAPVKDLLKRRDARVEAPMVTSLINGQGYIKLSECWTYRSSPMQLLPTGESHFAVRYIADYPIEEERPFLTAWRLIEYAPTLSKLITSGMREHIAPPADRFVFGERYVEGAQYVVPGRALMVGHDSAPLTLEEARNGIARAEVFGCTFVVLHDSFAKWDGAADRLKELIEFGREKNVQIFVKRSAKDLLDPVNRYKALDDYIETLHDSGIAGIYFTDCGGPTAEMERWSAYASRAAGRRQFMIAFEDSSVPSGQRRSYPNQVSRLRSFESRPESAQTAVSDTIEPFTSLGMLPGNAGALDLRPEVPGGPPLIRRLARWITGEPYFMIIGHASAPLLADDRLRPVIGMIRTLPRPWEGRRVLPNSKVGELSVIAVLGPRTWHVCGISAGPAREVPIEFSWLPEGVWTAQVLVDDPTAPAKFSAFRRQVSTGDTLTIQVPERGGFVIRVALN